MKQIARNLTMAGGGFLNGLTHLILDRDGKFAPSFRGIIEAAGVKVLRLPPRNPNHKKNESHRCLIVGPRRSEEKGSRPIRLSGHGIARRRTHRR